MKLNKFTLSDDDASIKHKDQQYNLSTGYVFVSLEYDVINQELNLKWIKGASDGNETKPDELSIEFTGVDFLKTRERDIAKPYPRDEYISSMGFAANEHIAEFTGTYQNKVDDNHQHLGFEFASGLAIKFAATSATLSTKSNF